MENRFGGVKSPGWWLAAHEGEQARRDLRVDAGVAVRVIQHPPVGWISRKKRSPAAAGVRRALPTWLALNAGLALLVARGYVAAAGVAPGWDAVVYAYLAFAAPVVATVTLLGGVGALATLLPGGAALVRWLFPVVAALLLGFLWVDRAAFATYRFHVGGLAWGALGVPGALAELGVRPASPAGLAAALAGVALADGLALGWLARRASRAPSGGARGWWGLALVAFVLVVAERSAFLLAERAGRRDVVRMVHLVPFYPTLVGNDLRRVAPGVAATLGSAGAAVRPPPPPVRFAADAPRWNVLWIVLDSWRADALTPALTPVVDALGQRASVFRAHTSGGDATRYGLVSMLYGLPASSWSRLEIERRSPPLLATLRDRGWRLGVFTSVDMPDILSVVFGDVPTPWRVAAPPGRAADKDRATLATLERFLAAPDAGQPFFAFVHLLSTHWPYDPTCRLARTERGTRPRYERSIRCADRLVARALRAVSLRDTIVVVTSDHGEAFGEQGVHGHASGFTLPQLRVPLVLHIPGAPPAVVERATSHHDVPATLLEALGAELPSPAAGVGTSLVTGVTAPWIYACNMNECAIHDADGSVTFGVGARYPRELQIRDPAGGLMPADGALGRRRFAQVLALLALQRDALP